MNFVNQEVQIYKHLSNTHVRSIHVHDCVWGMGGGARICVFMSIDCICKNYVETVLW